MILFLFVYILDGFAIERRKWEILSQMGKTAIILGAAVWKNGASPALMRRVLKCAELYNEGAITRIIVTGGLGKYPPTEASIMHRVLIANGVPDDAITIEDKATSTFENFALSKLLTDTKEIIIVTDWYHVPRSWLVARHHGFHPQFACPSGRGAKTGTQIRAAAREAIAIPYYLIKYWR